VDAVPDRHEPIVALAIAATTRMKAKAFDQRHVVKA
jgi:hypothetical protein